GEKLAPVVDEARIDAIDANEVGAARCRELSHRPVTAGKAAGNVQPRGREPTEHVAGFGAQNVAFVVCGEQRILIERDSGQVVNRRRVGAEHLLGRAVFVCEQRGYVFFNVLKRGIALFSPAKGNPGRAGEEVVQYLSARPFYGAGRGKGAVRYPPRNRRIPLGRDRLCRFRSGLSAGIHGQYVAGPRVQGQLGWVPASQRRAFRRMIFEPPSLDAYSSSALIKAS